jgi:hypothetical protein
VKIPFPFCFRKWQKVRETRLNYEEVIIPHNHADKCNFCFSGAVFEIMLKMDSQFKEVANVQPEFVMAVASADLRDKVKVIIGGGPVNQAVVEFTGADAFGKDATEAVRLAVG